MQQYIPLQDLNLSAYRASLKELSVYAKAVRSLLPVHFFKPKRKRLFWLPIHYTIIGICVFLILKMDSIYFNILLSVIMGHSMGCLFFLGHELTHGAILKDKKSILFFTFFCYATWGMHPISWIHAHNRMHHQHTQNSVNDPDCWGKTKWRNKVVRILQPLLPGSHHPISYTFLFWFFTFYSFYICWLGKGILLKKREQFLCRFYFLFIHTTWLIAALFLHSWGIVLLFIIPISVANFVTMSYIATNHFLNPLTEFVNDPLANTLSVKTNSFWNFWHLNFSYHIEHHIFPYMSPKYAPDVAKILKEKYPDLYKEMPHRTALSLLYIRPKFYFDELHLYDPKTKKIYPTIALDEML